MKWFTSIYLIFVGLIYFGHKSYGQEIPVANYSTNSNGQVQLEVNSSADHYYILKVRHHVDSTFDLVASMTLGTSGTTTITEPLGNYPQEHYQVLEHPVNSPEDTDGDGIDDITEYNNIPFDNPINAAEPVTIENGLVAVNNDSIFSELAIIKEKNQWSPYLNGKEFLKFIILDFNTSAPKVYYINTNTHSLHIDFATFLGVDHLGEDVRKGHIIYHPNVLAHNGKLGAFAFNYTNNEPKDFITVQRTQELLAASMPFLENNLAYYVNANNEDEYYDELEEFQSSRVPALFETDIYAGVNYWGLNQAEGYGFFRQITLEEVPGPKDIVLYETLPNSLPRVGGIITSFIQTPLSHVNLRAIQDNIPNAFIRDPLDNDSIASLLNHYIYFKADQSDYIIRKATVDEVNEWYKNSRPDANQSPPLNLDYKSITPLNEITFDMYDGFGAKSANVAAMHSFGFEDGTVPDGFAIPFYFYQEFMKYNDFFEEIDMIISDPDFIADRDVRNEKLEAFREKIIKSDMPEWMLDELAEMHRSFPQGTSVRCRSSTNNEDLPGFSGAGLYASKTQHPTEGHISKSVKQVYASLWNLRAFEEREFYRINHFVTSMGILCHPNYSNEKVNGVGVSADPIYNTDNTFYLNSQVEGELITNPSGNSRPEVLLLNQVSSDEEHYSIVQYSNLINHDSLLMSEEHISQLRDYLSIIHNRFEQLYKAEGNKSFAMDIEYKINSNDQLVIKQARPWISYIYQDTLTTIKQEDQCELIIFPNPAKESINVTCDDCPITSTRVFDLTGKLIQLKTTNDSGSVNTHISIENLPAGAYIMVGFIDNMQCASKVFIKE